MSTTRSTVGVCPACEVEIPPGMVLIEYEKGGGTARFAECPSCGVPVHPR